jgi:dephospho-CoA kinase
LTGGIASGKSTAARLFAALGAELVDADVLAREAVAPGAPAWQAVVETFGPRVQRSDGTIDRVWLGEVVFNDSEKRAQLNAIIHPEVVRELQERIRKARAQPPEAGDRPRVLVAEVPLLVEAGLTGFVDRIVVVVAQQTTQVSRLMHDKGLTEAQAWARVRAQLPEAEKTAHADWIVDGEAPLAQMERQVRAIWEQLVTPSGSSGRKE